MRRSRDSQSSVALIVAAALSQAAFLLLGLGPGDPSVVICSVSALLVFGLPHGAFDVKIIKKVFGESWTLAAAVYIGLVGLGACVYLLSAPAFFFVFLVHSVLHFGDSDWPGESKLIKLLWGASVIALPSLFYPGLVTDLFSALVERSVASNLTWGLSLACLPVVLTLLLSVRRFRPVFVATIALAILYLSAGPILGFAAYMCLMHARKHLKHWRHLVDANRDGSLPGILTLVTLIAVILLIAFDAGSISITASVVRISFVALACLTFPHMALLYVASKSPRVSTGI